MEEKGHFYIHPEVVEAHIARGAPIPIGTLKLLLALKLLEYKDDEPRDFPPEATV